MKLSKRLFDIAGSGAGLLVLWPALVVMAVIVKLDGGPAFFRQTRIGRRGRPFRILKFRTMVVDAERLGPQITANGDRRVTSAGRWLRRTKLDELPQLVNVLVGEMSLVGPRPEVPRYVERYTPQQRRVLDITPGLTDPASLRYLDEGARLAAAPDPEQLYVGELMPDKIRLNLEYAESATMASDFAVILRTIGLISRQSAIPSGA
ncbi:MAG: sugar transferase [Gemmatimonadaceae bacterium]|nr:sugar transferase [Gemmatimonadaceae bacterium]NUQ91460.1 sugar transferase [Gemmatimonadaceae bacterium]NUR20298.1 sugar transferase [Gemmatimonadaceae bacterium]NUS95987.1 sugar transferase [Gemmatimonadaceae bacterium]